MNTNKYDIKVRDSIVEPNRLRLDENRMAYYRKPEGKNSKAIYKVWVYLEGKDLPFIKRVKYILHESFNKPFHIVERTHINQNCQLVFWTWGIFLVKVEIEDFKGRVFSLEHRLSCGEQTKDTSIGWVKT